MEILAVGIVFSVAIGIVVGLPVLVPQLFVPQLRQFVNAHGRLQLSILVLEATTSFVVTFGLFSYLPAYVLWGLGTASAPDQEEKLKDEKAIVNELWLRYMFAPIIGVKCYSSQPRICDLADDYLGSVGKPPTAIYWTIDYMVVVLCGLVAGGANLGALSFTLKQNWLHMFWREIQQMQRLS